MVQKAKLLFRSKFIYPDGAIREMILWELPRKLKGSTHKFKYRLYYGHADDKSSIRYDNEHGKGDHRHFMDNEEPYVFEDVELLVGDFLKDIEKLRGAKQ